MTEDRIARRSFLATIGQAAVSAGILLRSRDADAQFVVPNSGGTEPPKLKVPANACDCHHHVYDASRFTPSFSGGRIPPNARVEEYELLQRRLGMTRNVVVTPAAYYGDNRITLDAIARLGGGARGVALLRPDVTDAELKTLAAGGIRGLRFSFVVPGSFDMLEPLSKRVAAFGWHVHIWMQPDMIARSEELWNRFPTTLVFDHLGHVPQPDGLNHPAFQVIRRLLDKGNTWVNVSGAYVDSKEGPPRYSDVTRVAQAYVKAAPERMLWGSDWPHPGEKETPNDALLLDLLSEWAPDEGTRNRILVDNPAKLYGFS